MYTATPQPPKTAWEQGRQEPRTYHECNVWLQTMSDRAAHIEGQLSQRQAQVERSKLQYNDGSLPFNEWDDYRKWYTRATAALGYLREARASLLGYRRSRWPNGTDDVMLDEFSQEIVRVGVTIGLTRSQLDSLLHATLATSLSTLGEYLEAVLIDHIVDLIEESNGHNAANQ